MTEGLRTRIRALDDKQAIFVVNNLVQAAFSTSPQLCDLSDDEQMNLVETGVAREIGRTLPPVDVDATVSPSEAGGVAREALLALAATPGGDRIVTRALDTWFDRAADFGVLSVSVAIAPRVVGCLNGGRVHYRKYACQKEWNDRRTAARFDQAFDQAIAILFKVWLRSLATFHAVMSKTATPV